LPFVCRLTFQLRGCQKKAMDAKAHGVADISPFDTEKPSTPSLIGGLSTWGPKTPQNSRTTPQRFLNVLWHSLNISWMFLGIPWTFNFRKMETLSST
jgi:hypothetical protein